MSKNVPNAKRFITANVLKIQKGIAGNVRESKNIQNDNLK